MNNTMRGWRVFLAAGVMLVLGGCVTPGGYGGDPGRYGQSTPGYPAQYDSQLQGTVDGVDPRGYRILVVVDDTRTGRGQQVQVRYDQRTRLFYQGREHPVEGLERGDVIRIDVAQSGRELLARSIEVVRNVRDGGYGGGYGDDRYGDDRYDNDRYGDDRYGDDRDRGGYGNDLRGSIAFVDTRARLIRIDGAGGGSSVQMTYDARTTVDYQGRSYRPENLQRGDLVRIQARQVGSNQWLAERIVVERSVGR